MFALSRTKETLDSLAKESSKINPIHVGKHEENSRETGHNGRCSQQRSRGSETMA